MGLRGKRAVVTGSSRAIGRAVALALAAGISGRILSAAGGQVGLFAEPAGRLVAFRDDRDGGPWSVDFLAAAFGRSDAP